MTNDLKNSILIPIRIALIIWCVHFVQFFLSFDLGFLGVYPRTISGLLGIFFSPLIHGSQSHIISNTVPLIILSAALFYFYRRVAMLVFLNCYLTTGILVWLFGRPFYHIGASGLIYGIAFFLMLFGLFRKDVKSILVSIVVVGVYGSLIYGLMPDNPQTSWESHVFGAAIGASLAFYLRKSKRID